MKKIFILLSILLINGYAFSQFAPQHYELLKKKFSKQAGSTPVSNSILDIVIVNDTVWLGTSKGLSKSEDGGITWINYYNDPVFGDESISALGYYRGIIYAATGKTTTKNGQDLPEGTGLKISSDQGNTWISVPQSVDDPGDSSVTYGINTLRALPVTVAINNITFDIAFTPNTIWITTFAGGLRKSTDMGQTWQRVVLPPDFLNEIHPDSSYSFSLQPVAGAFGNESYLNHRVFSAAAANDSTLYVGTAGGINKSTDGGITWRKFNHTNQISPISGNFITALAYNQSNNSIWAASWRAEGQTEYTAVSASTDGGEKWDVFLSDEKAHNFGFKSYVRSGRSSTDIAAATDNGLFRTTNLGYTWISPTDIVDGVNQIQILLNQFFSVGFQKFDNDDLVWLGSGGEGLAKLTEDNNGVWSGDWVVLLASQKLDSPEKSYAFPNPFSPNNSYTRIKYQTKENGSTVSIRVMDFGMNLVRTLIQNAPRAGKGDQFEFWNGRNDAGTIVANGVYFYRVDINDEKPVFGKIMVIR